MVAAVLGGDVDAYAVLVLRYQDAYRRFAARMLGSPDDADDALQLAFVRAYRSLRQCRDPRRFGAWLYQIVINECRTFAVRRTRRERRVLSDETSLTNAVAPPNDPANQSTEEIRRALDVLDPEQREAFVLKHVEQMSYEEMVEVTGVGESALKMRVKRARDRLRELLERVPNDR